MCISESKAQCAGASTARPKWERLYTTLRRKKGRVSTLSNNACAMCVCGFWVSQKWWLVAFCFVPKFCVRVRRAAKHYAPCSIAHSIPSSPAGDIRKITYCVYARAPELRTKFSNGFPECLHYWFVCTIQYMCVCVFCAVPKKCAAENSKDNKHVFFPCTCTHL